MKYLISALFALFATQNIAYPWCGNMSYPTVIMINPKIKINININKKIVLPKSNRSSNDECGWTRSDCMQSPMMSSSWRSQWGC